MIYKSIIDALNKVKIDDVEDYLRYQISELSNEPMKSYVRGFFNLLAQKQNVLNFKDKNGKRVVHIDYVKRIITLE